MITSRNVLMRQPTIGDLGENPLAEINHRLLQEWVLFHNPALNKLWSNWIDFPNEQNQVNPRTHSDLRKIILESRIKNFKARALWIMLAPRAIWAPYHWSVKEFQANIFYAPYVDLSILENLDYDLINFVASLVIEYAGFVQINDGILDPADRYQLLMRYNSIILTLFRLVKHPGVISQLHSVYTLRNSLTLPDFTYEPFINLLLSADVSDPYKQQACHRMEGLVNYEEQNGNFVPLEWYADQIGELQYSQAPYYRSDILAGQINFLFQRIDQHPDMFRFWDTYLTLEKLINELNMEIGIKFFKHILGQNGNRVTPYTVNAIWVLEKFVESGKLDESLLGEIKMLIEKHKEKIVQEHQLINDAWLRDNQLWKQILG